MNDANSKQEKKTSFRSRLARRGREFLELGRVLFTEPTTFPVELLRFLRRSFRTIWDARGGGLYACGFLLTFVYLEIRMLVMDVVEADSVGGFFTEQATDFLFKYLSESIENSVTAFIWPIYVMRIDPPVGMVVLVILFFLFPRYLKRSVERWFFGANTTAEIRPDK